MKNGYNIKSKQEKELSKISSLIRSLGYNPNSSMCGDRPDICIPSIKNKEIGIEVTDYAERYYIKADSNAEVRGNLHFKAHKDFEKIIYSYIDHFDNREKDTKYYPKDSGYRISIWLAGGLFPYQDNLNDFKEIIYREIDNYLFPTNAFVNNKFIACARADLIPNASKSVIDYQLGYVECMTPVDDSIISEIIKEKNEKLLKYKECKSNESIKEYWLAICLPYQVIDTFDNYRFPSNIQTNYDKIYLVHDYRVWQIK